MPTILVTVLGSGMRRNEAAPPLCAFGCTLPPPLSGRVPGPMPPPAPAPPGVSHRRRRRHTVDPGVTPRGIGQYALSLVGANWTQPQVGTYDSTPVCASPLRQPQ